MSGAPTGDFVPLYFGCWEQTGHDAFRPGMRRVRERLEDISPWGTGLDSRRWDVAEPHLEVMKGLTAVGFRDRSVDSRPGSISVFVLPGELDLSSALGAARAAFPLVFARVEKAHAPTSQEDGS